MLFFRQVPQTPLNVAGRQHREIARWHAERPELPPSMYILVGPAVGSRFRLEDLAVDRDLIGVAETVEPLPPLPD